MERVVVLMFYWIFLGYHCTHFGDKWIYKTFFCLQIKVFLVVLRYWHTIRSFVGVNFCKTYLMYTGVSTPAPPPLPSIHQSLLVFVTTSSFPFCSRKIPINCTWISQTVSGISWSVVRDLKFDRKCLIRPAWNKFFCSFNFLLRWLAWLI